MTSKLRETHKNFEVQSAITDKDRTSGAVTVTSTVTIFNFNEEFNSYIEKKVNAMAEGKTVEEAEDKAVKRALAKLGV